MTLQNKINILQSHLSSSVKNYSNAIFTTSLSADDMVITDVIAKLKLNFQLVTLDTLKLNDETLRLLDKTRRHYGLEIVSIKPDDGDLDLYYQNQTDSDIFKTIEHRKKCCFVRKVKPLRRALEGKDLWVTGQRRAQSSTRINLPLEEYDTVFRIQKINPLADWSSDDVWNYTRTFQVPFNSLYDQNYTSIGCAPCTRPTQPGEDERDGRWWWENADTKECGLHFVNGKITRTNKLGVSDV